MFRKITRPVLFVGALGILITGITLFSNGADAYNCDCTCNNANGPVQNAGKMNPNKCAAACEKLNYKYSTCKLK